MRRLDLEVPPFIDCVVWIKTMSREGLREKDGVIWTEMGEVKIHDHFRTNGSESVSLRNIH